MDDDMSRFEKVMAWVALIGSATLVVFLCSGCTWIQDVTRPMAHVDGGKVNTTRHDRFQPLTDAELTAKIDELIRLINAAHAAKTDADSAAALADIKRAAVDLRLHGQLIESRQEATAEPADYDGPPLKSFDVPAVTTALPDPRNAARPNTSAALAPTSVANQDEATIQSAIIHAQGLVKSGAVLVWIGGAMFAAGLAAAVGLKVYKIGGVLAGAGFALAVCAMTLQNRPELGAIVLAAVGALMLAGLALAVWSEWQQRRTKDAAKQIAASVDPIVQKALEGNDALAVKLQNKQSKLARAIVDEAQAAAK